MEKRERVNKQTSVTHPSQTVGQERKNQSVLMHSHFTGGSLLYLQVSQRWDFIQS